MNIHSHSSKHNGGLSPTCVTISDPFSLKIPQNQGELNQQGHALVFPLILSQLIDRPGILVKQRSIGRLRRFLLRFCLAVRLLHILISAL